MHLEALEVFDDAEGIQRASIYDENLEALVNISGDGGFRTCEIEGRQYVVCAYPFCG